MYEYHIGDDISDDIFTYTSHSNPLRTHHFGQDNVFGLFFRHPFDAMCIFSVVLFSFASSIFFFCFPFFWASFPFYYYFWSYTLTIFHFFDITIFQFMCTVLIIFNEFKYIFKTSNALFSFFGKFQLSSR